VIGNTYGSGGLLTTASDLLTWNEALDSGRLGSFVTTELQRKAVLNGGRSIDYGGGLDIRRYNGQDWFEHGGSIPGFKSTLERFPQSRLSIAVLCNNDDAQPRLISGKIAEALVPAESQPETAKTGAALTLTPEQLAARTGLFIIEQTGFPVVITADKGRLVVDKEPPMETISENRFRSPGPWGELVFKTPDLAERVVKTQPDGLQTLRRIDATIPAEAQLSEFTGRYNSDEAEGSYSIVLEKGALVMTGSDLQSREIGRPIPISPVARDLFQMPGVMIRFNRGPDGKVNSFDLTTERVRALRFHRTPVAAPAVSSKEALIIIIGIGKSSLICHPEQKVKSPTVSSNFSGFSMRAENGRF
jgi:hypothetical protein